MKHHITRLQSFLEEIAPCLDDDSDGQTYALVDAIRYAIERLSNQERIAERIEKLEAELKSVLIDAGRDLGEYERKRTDGGCTPIAPDSTFDRVYNAAQIAKAAPEWEGVEPDAWLENLRGTGEEKP